MRPSRYCSRSLMTSSCIHILGVVCSVCHYLGGLVHQRVDEQILVYNIQHQQQMQVQAVGQHAPIQPLAAAAPLPPAHLQPGPGLQPVDPPVTNGFRRLRHLVVAACRGLLEIDIGYLFICSAPTYLPLRNPSPDPPSNSLHYS